MYLKTQKELVELAHTLLNFTPKYNKITEEEIKQLKYIKAK